jgi:hypothetical protein
MQVKIPLQKPLETFWTIDKLDGVALEAKLIHLGMIKLTLNDRTGSEGKEHLLWAQRRAGDRSLLAEPRIDTRTLSQDLAFRIVQEPIERVVILLILSYEHLLRLRNVLGSTTKEAANLELISIEARLNCISESFVFNTQTEAWRLDDGRCELPAVVLLPQPHHSIVSVFIPSFQVLKLPFAHISELSKTEIFRSQMFRFSNISAIDSRVITCVELCFLPFGSVNIFPLACM